MSHFIINQNKSGQNNQYRIDSTKVNLKAVLKLEYEQMRSIDEV